jgi:translation initiation factor 3 subunit I
VGARPDILHHSIQGQDRQGKQSQSTRVSARNANSLQLVDVEELNVLKSYIADTPLNSAAITPVKDYVILGGGQAAMDVTTTSARQGKFEARFYHKIFMEEIGRVRGHFGPLNYVAVHPQGTGYCSGGEDGYVRVHHFDKPYFDFMYEVEREAAREQANL